MSKRDKPYIISLDGKLLHAPSLLEVKMESTPDEWSQITSQTVKYFCFAKTLKEIGMPLLREDWEKEDERILRDLKRTVETMKNMDARRMSEFNIKEICDSYAARMLKGITEIQEMMSELSGRLKSGDNNVQVSGL